MLKERGATDESFAGLVLFTAFCKGKGEEIEYKEDTKLCEDPKCPSCSNVLATLIKSKLTTGK